MPQQLTVLALKKIESTQMLLRSSHISIKNILESDIAALELKHTV